MEEQLWQACEDGNVGEVRNLLQNEQINTNWQNSTGATPFWIACFKGYIEVVKLLLSDERVDINKAENKYGTLPFYIACRGGHIEVVKLLLSDERVDINKANKYGKTPFYTACEQRNIEIVQLLFNNTRIEINNAKNVGQTLFYFACYNGHIEIVKFFLLLNDERIDINKVNSRGETPFWIACKKGHIGVVKLLLSDQRVDVNKANNKNDETPFYIACENGHIEIVKLLLLNEKRISIRKKAKEGKTAIDIANEKNHSDIVKLIKEFDTEQRNLEYLETFQHFPFLYIEKGTFTKQDFPILNEHLKKNKNIKELRFTNCDLTPSNIIEILKTLIWKYENLQLRNLQNIEIDDIKLESTEGLEIIPIEIRNQGTKSIVQYILDLCKSSNSKPRYRTKLMVVGHENVGKTTLLDCLFPLIDETRTRNFARFNYEYHFTLEGKYLSQYYQGELYKEYILENRQWNVEKIKETGLELIPLGNKSPKKIEIDFKDEEIRDKWIERLKRVIFNSATHGIDVNTHIWNSSTLNQLQNNNLEPKQNENEEKKNKDDQVEYSTWDFAGQNDYYNTHHYFLSNRSIFLVLYRMDQGIKGLESLDFWLKSLSFHLNQTYCDQNGKPFYSIIIIGTFLDSIVNENQNADKHLRQTKIMETFDINLKENRKRRIEEMDNESGLKIRKRNIEEMDNNLIVIGQNEDKNLREIKVMEIYNESGLKSRPFYFEVSCSTLENIEELREIIFNTSLSHSYMGESVPIGYLSIEKSIYELRKSKQDHLIIEIQELIDHVQSQSQSQSLFDIEFTKRGLRLFHEWGICIYFDEPIELSNIVILDPQHFTKVIFGNLFKADESSRQLRLNGIIDYSQLNKIWNGPANLIDTYVSLLQKFEVCFILKNQQNENGNKNENEKKLIIPNLLSEDKTKTIEDKLQRKWPITIPRGEIEIERIFSFNQVPSEMVSRLLVRFHKKIANNIIWRRGVLLKHFDKKNENENENENVLCLLEVKMSENLFEIKIRGKERKECLEMMKYIYDEVKIVSGNYGGVKWKECVRSPHFSKGLIDLGSIKEDCKLELKDRKLICPITHFPIYGEELLFKTGLLDSLDSQNDLANDYWNYSYESQNQECQKSETEIIFENLQKLNEKEYEKVEYLLNLFGFDTSKVDKVIGVEKKSWKRSFDDCSEKLLGRHRNNPNLFKREDWIEQSESELRTSFIQYLGDYISKFRKVGWNHGNNVFVIPIIQGTTEEAAWRISDYGFGTVCKIDAGYYSQGVYFTSNAKYAAKYCNQTPKVFVIGFMIVGNPFPVIEHPFMTDEKGKVVLEKQGQKDQNGMEICKRKINENGYFGKSTNPGYNSHISLVNENSTYPITKVEQLNEEWTVDEFVVHESQTYPSYIVYYK